MAIVVVRVVEHLKKRYGAEERGHLVRAVPKDTVVESKLPYIRRGVNPRMPEFASYQTCDAQRRDGLAYDFVDRENVAGARPVLDSNLTSGQRFGKPYQLIKLEEVAFERQRFRQVEKVAAGVKPNRDGVGALRG